MDDPRHTGPHRAEPPGGTPVLSTLLEILLGVLVVVVVTAFTGYFVAQEFGYMAVDRSRLRARAGRR